MNTILKLILTLLFDSVTFSGIILRILFILGSWMLLKKSGDKPFRALIPWVREYRLGCCANRESDGRIYSIASFFYTLASILNILAQANLGGRIIASLDLVVPTFMITAALVCFIFRIRIFLGFIEVYDVKKGWIILCISDITCFIPMLIWGLSKKYQPLWQIEDLQSMMERLATGGSARITDKGLTINIKERSVWEFFRKKLLLRDIHMNIPKGHMVLLLGGSGAGKTTFLNAVTGYEKANATITLNGEDLYKDYKKLQYEIGFVPQTETVRGKDTVMNTLMDAARLRMSVDIPPDKRKKHINDVLDTFGLTPAKNTMVEKMSGGQKKRLSVSMEYLSGPSLFILDEPDSGLDGVMARSLFTRLREIADSGRIVIVITHTPDRVVDYFDDVIVLAKDSTRTGRLAYYGSIADAKEFFGCNTMEGIVKSINPPIEGGDGKADEFVLKYAEVANG